MKKKQFDIFLSYSSDDRQKMILPFWEAIKHSGIKAWVDIHEVGWGDSIVNKIQEGLTRSSFILTFISNSYLQKLWPMKELSTALASQMTGRTVILPILLGVSLVQINNLFPFLSEIKHLSVSDYDCIDAVPQSFIQLIIDELVKAKKHFTPIRILESHHLTTLNGEIKTVCFDTHYCNSFRIISTRQAQAIDLPANNEFHNNPSRLNRALKPREIADLRQLVCDLSGKYYKEELFVISCIWDEFGTYSDILFVLADGNAFFVHGSSILHDYDPDEPNYKGHYIEMNAPERPSCVKFVVGSQEIILGYPDGRIFLWRRRDSERRRICEGNGFSTLASSGSINAIDASYQSVLVLGSNNGEIGILSRKDLKCVKLVQANHGSVNTVSVSKSPNSRYFASGHSDGVVQIRDFEGKLQSEFSSLSSPVTALKFLPLPYAYIAVCSRNNISIYDYMSGQVVCAVKERGGLITAVNVGINVIEETLWLVAGYKDGYSFCWKLNT